MKKKLPAKRKATTTASSKRNIAPVKSGIKPTRQHEAEARKAHDLYWKSYIQGDTKTLASLLDDRYTQIGSVEEEVFFNKKDAVKFVKTTIDQVAGNVEMRNRITRAELVDGFILFNEQCDLYVLIEGAWIFYSKFRASSLMQKSSEGWKMIHQHSSLPDSKAQEGENIAIEKISAENLQLRDAVKRRTVELEQKNKDLAIEAALERVRAIAMGMKKPDDLPGICEVLYAELKTLGFTEIRNAMINIHDDDKGTFVNFDYSDEIGRSINHLVYNIHPVIEKQIRQMRSAGDAFSETSFKGKDLKDWKAFRKKIGEKDDPRIDNSKALYYYFYSIGTGAVGISTFDSIAEEKKNVLKRFRNVFEFAYRRYTDVAQAETQAREAQIELALERVRARTMAMHDSQDVGNTVATMFEQLVHLGITTNRCGILIFSDTNNTEVWTAKSGPTGEAALIIGHLDVTIHPMLQGVRHAWKNKETFYSYELAGDDIKNYYSAINNYPGYPTRFNLDNLPSKEIHSDFFFPEGAVFAFTSEPVAEEAALIFKRFAGVFGQTYRRYLDLLRAEAQVREAQIEAALERTRTQSMIMQHSNELDDTLRVFHEQVLLLGIPSAFSFLWLPDEDKDRHIFWAAWAENGSPTQLVDHNSTVFKSKAINYPLDRNEPATAQCLLDWKSNEPVYSYHVPPAAVENYFASWQELIDGFEQLKPKYFFSGLYYVEAFMKYGCFGVMVAADLREDEKKILGRFAIEFERTYRRFLDLQKAEAQAREAKIEAALERIRARALAMHRSDEFTEVAKVMREQMGYLGQPELETSAVHLYEEDADNIFSWRAFRLSSDLKGNITFGFFKIPKNSCAIARAFVQKFKSKASAYTIEVSGAEQTEWYKILFKLAPEVHEAMKKSGTTKEKRYYHFSKFTGGALLMVTSKEPAADTMELQKRSALVFDLAYRRFKDLQKAEAQARESQIQLAMERVRARTMAMQRSEELADVALALFQQVRELGIKAWATGFNIWQEGNSSYIDWMTGPTGEFMKPYTVDLTTHPIFIEISEARKRGEDFHVFDFQGKALVETYELLSSVVNKKEFEKFIESGFQIPTRQINHYVFGAQVSLLFITYEPCPEAHDIFKRFGKVFEQTYTRFLDLQKAEAQAREAQIEAALERVRSRSMAMHKSEQLPETAQVLFEQFAELGKIPDRIAIGIIKEELQVIEWWATDQMGGQLARHFDASILEPAIAKYFAAWKEGKDSIMVDLSGEALKEWVAYVRDVVKMPIDDSKMKGRRVHHGAFFSQGLLLISAHEPMPNETMQLLVRFAKVFSQTYTRFLDLQKAEAQAREAKIEAALERVRSRTLAMQKSDELAETAAVLFKQLIWLGIEPNRLYITIIKDDEANAEFWITDEDGSKVSSAFETNLNNNHVFKKMLDGWNKKKDSLTIDMKGKELQEYFQYLSSLHVPFKGGLSQTRRMQYIGYFNKGFIGMASPDDQPKETIQLLVRFAAVFNLTFTRFNDLKMAEAHAQQAEQDLIAIKEAKQKAEDALTELQSTQKQLIQSEKMASLGELTAGIAHEIQNPLNFVNNFSEVSNELIKEIQDIRHKTQDQRAESEEDEILNDIAQNLEKINHHGKRASDIVKGMLQHSRTSSGVKEPTNINALADEYLRLAYHGLRAKDKTFNATMKTDFDETIGNINIIPQDIGRVILNLITNAFYAVNERGKLNQAGYEPTVIVSTHHSLSSGEGRGEVLIIVKDNGNGIPQKILDKIFQPFFTTKPTGQGTGLGLSLSYDIITKVHQGEIKVTTKEGEGTEFIVVLPT